MSTREEVSKARLPMHLSFYQVACNAAGEIYQYDINDATPDAGNCGSREPCSSTVADLPHVQPSHNALFNTLDS